VRTPAPCFCPRGWFSHLCHVSHLPLQATISSLPTLIAYSPSLGNSVVTPMWRLPGHPHKAMSGQRRCHCSRLPLKVMCHVRKKPTPLKLNVKGLGYAIHDSCQLETADGRIVDLAPKQPNHVDFGQVRPGCLNAGCKLHII